MTDTVSRGFGKKISSLSLCPQVGVPPLEMVSSTPLRAGHFFPTFCAHGSCTTCPRCAKSQGRERREGRESTLQQSRDEHLVAAVKKNSLTHRQRRGCGRGYQGVLRGPSGEHDGDDILRVGPVNRGGPVFFKVGGWVGGRRVERGKVRRGRGDASDGKATRHASLGENAPSLLSFACFPPLRACDPASYHNSRGAEWQKREEGGIR